MATGPGQSQQLQLVLYRFPQPLSSTREHPLDMLMNRLLWAHQSLTTTGNSLLPEQYKLISLYKSTCADLHDELRRLEKAGLPANRSVRNLSNYVREMNQYLNTRESYHLPFIRDPCLPQGNLLLEIIRFRRRAYCARYSEYVQLASFALLYRQPQFQLPLDEPDKTVDIPSGYWSGIEAILSFHRNEEMRKPPDQRAPFGLRFNALREACKLIGIQFEQLQYCINIFVSQGAQHHPIIRFFHHDLHRLPSVLAVDLAELPLIFPPSQPREFAIFYQVIHTLIDSWYITEDDETHQSLDWNEWRPTAEFEQLAAIHGPPSYRSQRPSPSEVNKSRRDHVDSITSRATSHHQFQTLNQLDEKPKELRHCFFNAADAGWIRMQAFRAIARRQNGMEDPFRAAEIFGVDLSTWMVAEKEIRHLRREREDKEAKQAVDEILADMGRLQMPDNHEVGRSMPLW